MAGSELSLFLLVLCALTVISIPSSDGSHVHHHQKDDGIQPAEREDLESNVGQRADSYSQEGGEGRSLLYKKHGVKHKESLSIKQGSDNRYKHKQAYHHDTGHKVKPFHPELEHTRNHGRKNLKKPITMHTTGTKHVKKLTHSQTKEFMKKTGQSSGTNHRKKKLSHMKKSTNPLKLQPKKTHASRNLSHKKPIHNHKQIQIKRMPKPMKSEHMKKAKHSHKSVHTKVGHSKKPKGLHKPTNIKVTLHSKKTMGNIKKRMQIKTKTKKPLLSGRNLKHPKKPPQLPKKVPPNKKKITLHKVINLWKQKHLKHSEMEKQMVIKKPERNSIEKGHGKLEYTSTDLNFGEESRNNKDEKTNDNIASAKEGIFRVVDEETEKNIKIGNGETGSIISEATIPRDINGSNLENAKLENSMIEDMEKVGAKTGTPKPDDIGMLIPENMRGDEETNLKDEKEKPQIVAEDIELRKIEAGITEPTITDLTNMEPKLLSSDLGKAGLEKEEKIIETGSTNMTSQGLKDSEKDSSKIESEFIQTPIEEPEGKLTQIKTSKEAEKLQ